MMYQYDLSPPYGKILRYGKQWPLAHVSDEDRLAIMDMPKFQRDQRLNVMEKEIEAARRWAK